MENITYGILIIKEGWNIHKTIDIVNKYNIGF